MGRRPFLVAVALLGAIGLAAGAPPSVAPPGRTRFDARAAAAPAERPSAEKSAAMTLPPGAASFEPRFGVPTFLWGRAAEPLPVKIGTHDPVAAARAYLGVNAPLYRLQGEDVAAAVVQNVHDTGRGAVIVTFGQRVNGIDVFGERTSVVMDRALDLVAIAGHIGPAATPPSLARAFVLHPADAVAQAARDLAGLDLAGALVAAPEKSAGGYVTVTAPAAPGVMGPLAGPARAKAVYFRMPSGYVPAYYVELAVQHVAAPDADRFAYVVAADDGRVLVRHDQTLRDAFTYRVWADTTGDKLPQDGPSGNADAPHPTGLNDSWRPAYVAPQLVTLQNGPISTNDAWLPATATTTTGNNVDAYADISGADGFDGTDVRPPLTSTRTFDFTYNTGAAPTTTAQRRAAATQLFYTVNFLHDWFYDAGFDEAAGNAQADNFGRGGVGGDPILAEAQDSSGRNNANMSTPADGASPRMQMFIFDAGTIDRDGALDTQIVTHEWGHYISNRLVGDGWGLLTDMSGGLGEGWGDFHALLLTVREDDLQVAANANWNGVYALAGYANRYYATAYYFGIRRVPYSTDFSKNPLTYKHITNGVAITGAPVAFGADGSDNAEVHNAGEVWTTMLWEGYAALLRSIGDRGLTFADAQDRMKRYLVASYKATPLNPTFLEARDALLAVIRAEDPDDYVLFAEAFARRGAGVLAVSPDRYSTTNEGAVESFVPATELVARDVTLDGALEFCDGDELLDGGETGHLRITLQNVGTVPLGATSATVTTTNPDVTFPAGSSVTFPASVPFGTTTASVPIRLVPSLATSQVITLTISYGDAGGAFAGTLQHTFRARVNTDFVPSSSATDTVETDSPWTPWLEQGSGESWTRDARDAANAFWHGIDAGSSIDASLISPTVSVGSGAFSITFQHRYSFERSDKAYDGGIIEVSVDGGPWTDVGSTVAGYTGTLATGTGNPLGGKSAYTGASAAYPLWSAKTLSFGTQYANRTVAIRFRLGTDAAVGAPGWDIDEIAFSGITNQPFAAVVADRRICDADGDGTRTQDDCAPTDPALWSMPSAIGTLRLAGTSTTTLTWSAPSAPGSSALLYDVLRSHRPDSFGQCLSSGVTTTTASDAAAPGPFAAYLVVVRNGCGAQAGSASDGTPRVVVSDCP